MVFLGGSRGLVDSDEVAAFAEFGILRERLAFFERLFERRLVGLDADALVFFGQVFGLDEQHEGARSGLLETDFADLQNCRDSSGLKRWHMRENSKCPNRPCASAPE